MVGINLSTPVGDAVQATTTTGTPVPVTLGPTTKSVCLLIIAPTGTQFWVRQAANSGALPANASVIAKTPDLTTTTGNIHLLDLARVLDPTLGIYCSAAAVVVTVLMYNQGYTTLETGSLLAKTILPSVSRVP